MSFKVLVIPEDPTNNGYILKPLAERILLEVGKPNARVTILTNPRLGGYDHAVAAIKDNLVDRYAHFDLWLFLPDADRATGLRNLETAMAARNIVLRCCAARPEIEAWLLAGQRQKLSCQWSEVANHPRLKEEVFEPFIREFGDPRSAGGGRESLMRETLANFRGLLELCPELRELTEALKQLIGS